MPSTASLLVLSLIAGLATCFGALVVVWYRGIPTEAISLFLGLASGIMGSVALVDLLPTALRLGGRTSLLGLAGGIALMAMLNALILHGGDDGQRYLERLGYLVALGIALHDLPEGMAIAVGYAAGAGLGPTILLAITLHNIPEGMAMAVPLRLGGASPLKVLALNVGVSAFTPLGTLAGLGLVGLSWGMVSQLLALAAGAMFYLVLRQLSPAALSLGHPRQALVGAVGGVVAGILLALWE